MKFSHLLLFAAGVPLLASAHAQHAMPAVTDANAPVTPLQYQSVFADYAVVKDAPQSPDKDWIRANRALLGEEAETPASTSRSVEQPAAGASQKAPAPAPAPTQGKHEHKGAHQ